MKIREWVSKNIDGVCHFLVVYSLVFTVGSISLFWSIILGIFISFGKEIYDDFSYGKFSLKDILFDFAGLALGVTILSLIRRM